MKFNIDTKIDINFSEDQIKALLKEAITAEMPDIVVEDISFVIRRNPTVISASVDASMKGFNTPSESPIQEEESPEESSQEPETVSGLLDLS